MKIQLYTDLNTYKQPLYLTGFFVFAVIQMLFTSAILYGYSSLLVIFKDMKLYQQNCVETSFYNINQNSNNYSSIPRKTLQNATSTWQCDGQDKALNLSFAFAIIFQSVIKVVCGSIVDRVGARSTQYIACIFMMFFGLTLAFVDQEKEYLMFLAFMFLGIAASFLSLCPYQVVNILYKKRKSVLMSILSGSVDGSTVVFIIYLELYEKGLSLSKIVIGYSVLIALMTILVTTFMYPSQPVLVALVDDDVRSNLSPKQQKRRRLHAEDFAASHMSSYSMYQDSIQRSLQEIDEAEEREALLASLSHSLAMQWSQSPNLSTSNRTSQWHGGKYGTITEHVTGYKSDEVIITTSYFDKNANKETEPLVDYGKREEIKANKELSLRQYIFSGLYLVFCYVLSIFLLKIVYFIGNLDKYLLGMTDVETATWYTKMFGYVQCSGILIAPICSLLFNKREKNEVDANDEFLGNVKILILPSVVVTMVLVLMNILLMVENIILMIPIFFLFLIGNTLGWCLMVVYVSYLFPAKYYCTLLGISNSIIGVFSFAQYPLLHLEQNVFNGRQFYTNFVFLILLISTAVLPMYLVYFYNKRLRSKAVDALIVP